MIDILLINPLISMRRKWGPFASVGARAPRLGLCYLAAMVRSKGFSVNILDAEALDMGVDTVLEQIARQQPRFIGLTASTPCIDPTADLAKAVKARFDIPIILGGRHITALPTETMAEFPQFDIGVVGEGELTLVELLESLTEGKDPADVDGLIYRTNGQLVRTPQRRFIEDLDSLPFPAWDLLPDLAKVYKPLPFCSRRLPSTSLVVSRGCWAKCWFCDRSMFGNHIRTHSARYVVGMIKLLMKDYGIRDFFIDDDMFTVPRKRVVGFCNLVIDERLDITWACNARTDCVDEELLRLMKRAGCWQIAYGIESGSQEVLDFMQKGISLEEARRMLTATRKAGIMTKGFFTFGFLKETKETLAETLDFMLTADLDDATMSFATPLPQTEFMREADRYGKLAGDRENVGFYNISFVPSGMTEDDLLRFRKRAVRKFYLRPRIFWSYLKRAVWCRRVLLFMIRGGLTMFRLPT